MLNELKLFGDFTTKRSELRKIFTWNSCYKLFLLQGKVVNNKRNIIHNRFLELLNEINKFGYFITNGSELPNILI